MRWPASLALPGRSLEAVGNGGPRYMTVAAFAVTELGLRPASHVLSQPFGARRPIGGRDSVVPAPRRRPARETWCSTHWDSKPGGRAGIFSGRPWRSRYDVDGDVVGAMRRRIPLDFQVSDTLLAVLAGRGVILDGDLEHFFYPSLDHLHDPFELQEMDLAVARTFEAVRRGEHVAVHGDFDVDGITGSALLAETLARPRTGRPQGAGGTGLHPRPRRRRLRRGQPHDPRVGGQGRDPADHRGHGRRRRGGDRPGPRHGHGRHRPGSPHLRGAPGGHGPGQSPARRRHLPQRRAVRGGGGLQVRPGPEAGRARQPARRLPGLGAGPGGPGPGGGPDGPGGREPHPGQEGAGALQRPPEASARAWRRCWPSAAWTGASP